MRLLPFLALGTVFVGAFVAVSALIYELNEVTDEDTPPEVLTKIKKVQNELARLYDLKLLNDKRESTGTIEKVELMVAGVEVTELLKTLDVEMDRLTAKYRTMTKKTKKKNK